MNYTELNEEETKELKKRATKLGHRMYLLDIKIKELMYCYDNLMIEHKKLNERINKKEECKEENSF